MGEGTEWECWEQKPAPALLEDKEDLSVATRRVRAELCRWGGASNHRAAGWDKEWACGPDKKNVFMTVWRYDTDLVVVVACWEM